MLDNNMQQQPMNTSFNEDEFNKLINKMAASWGSFGISAEEAGKAINDLTTKLDEFNKIAPCDAYEIRGGRGNKKNGYAPAKSRRGNRKLKSKI